MPWTTDDPPNVAKNWSDEERSVCIRAANSALADGKSDEDAIFACIAAAGKGRESMARETLDMEIFKVGKWNGLEFSNADIDGMVAAFNALKDRHNVPLKLGHSDERDIPEGQPALGWLESVWNDAGKLMARAKDIPDMVMDALDKRLYRNVSVEIDFDVENRGVNYDMVLSGVALLGAEIPAVNGMADLQSFMSLNGQKRLCFTAIEQKKVAAKAAPKKKVMKMDNDEVMAKLAELTDTVTSQSAKLAEFQIKSSELEVENRDLRRNEEARTSAAQKEAVVFRRRDLTNKLDRLVKDQMLIPAQREQFTKSTAFTDDTMVMDMTIESMTQMLGVTGKKVVKDIGGASVFSRKSEYDNANDDIDPDETPDHVLARRAKKFSRENKVDISRATDEVLADDPKLAKAWFSRQPSMNVGG